MVLYAWSGKKASLHVGVARSANAELSAHAWLELEGVTVLGHVDDNRYIELTERPV
jgi:hypothetical protein